MTLSQNQFLWLSGIAAALIAIILIGFFYISRKYPKQSRKSDAVYKGFFLFLILMLGYIVFAMLFLTPEEAKKNVKWPVIAGAVFILFYSIVSIYSKRPIPSWKLWNKYVLVDVKRFLNAEPYAGTARLPSFKAHKVIVVGSSSYLDSRIDDPYKVVDVFLGQAQHANILNFINARDKYTGEDVYMKRNPTLEEIKGLFGKDIISSFKNPLSSFDTSTETTTLPQDQKPQETTT